MEKVIVDIAIILAGLYVTYLGANMLSTKQVNPAMLTEEGVKKSKKKGKELAIFWGKGMLPIGIVAILLGICGIIFNVVIDLKTLNVNYIIFPFVLLLGIAFALLVKQGKDRYM